MNIDELHTRFMEGQKLAVIAIEMNVSVDALQQTISKQRKLNPDKWPSRHKGKLVFQLFHIYECQDCVVTFAVEQDFENQSDVCCPICWSDENLRDVASAEMKIKK